MRSRRSTRTLRETRCPFLAAASEKDRHLPKPTHSGTSNENRAQATAQNSKLDFKAEPAWPSNPTLCPAIANGKICQITVSCVCRPDARTQRSRINLREHESCDRTLHNLRETRGDHRHVDAPSAISFAGERMCRVCDDEITTHARTRL